MAKNSVTGKTSLFTFSDEVISVETLGEISYYRTDERHMITDILDGTGKVKATIEYDEYGVIANPEVVSTGGNIFTYTGHVYDESTGLYYAKARYYDAETGRFVSGDSYKGEKGEILSHNLYIYGYNNPNQYIDFSGHNALDVISGLGDALDDNFFFGAVKWIIDKALGKNFHWKNELHYYAGRIIGDVISMIHGFWSFCKAVTKIVGGLVGGGAITISSGGVLTIQGAGIAIAGVTAGTIEVTYAGKVITAAASNFDKDVAKFAELAKGGSSATNVQWTNHGNKHVPLKNISWNKIVKSTKNGGPAKYHPDVNIEMLERTAWKDGISTTNGKTWKVMKFDKIIGASDGIQTPYIRVEMSANTIHGHPITPTEYAKLIK